MGECIRMSILAIDLETYSELDIKKVGLYKYAENSEILLFAYAFDDEPVQVVDIIGGEPLPFEVIEALQNEDVMKVAYNAAFERVVLNHHYPNTGIGEPSQWFCTMVQGFTLGLPGGLDKVGKALGIEEDKQKLATGKKLIQYFSKPCRPTKVNGGRTRNRPQHDTEKWAMFKEYCRQDVEAERAIRKKLEKFWPIPSERQLWALDQRINDNGVLLDNAVIDGALQIDMEMKYQLTNEVIKITGVENPNSLPQITGWIRQKQPELKFDTFDKAARAELLKRDDLLPEVRKVIKLKNLLSKTSCKKYQAMKDMKCSDGRVHGMLQFYGASRTGRWAGRGVQLHNLPQNHLDDLDEARNAVKTANYEVLEQLYDSPADVLSQLIRTAFIAPANHRFIVADFSAIEARVIAWLADEKWRMQVFANGGDIYCASASQMFKVPVEKHGINGHLRQKGKVAELACIAEGELVLTDKGLVPIERVTTKHLVWDGSSWVRHEGVIYKGVREVIEYDGLTATADHLVYIKGDAATQGKPREIRFGEAASSRAHILQSGNGREAVWVCPHNLGRKALEQKDESLLCADPVCIMPKYSVDRTGEPEKGEVKRLSAMLSTETDTIVVRPKVYSRKTALRKSKRQGLSELWRKGYKIRVFKRNRSRLVPDEIISKDGPLNGNRQNRQQWELCSRKFADDKQEGKQLEQENHSAIRVPSKVLALQLQCGNSEVKTGTDKGGDNIRRLQSGNRKEKELANYCRKARVYDIRNAGPHHRFTVSGKLVHNCGYGGGVNALKAFGADKMGMTQQEMEATIKQWREASPHICKLWRSVEDGVKKAIRTKMVIVGGKGIKYKYYAPWLFIKLPSGRKLAYYKPRIEQEEGFGERITYEGVMLAGGWGRNYTWGGKLVENLVQGIARDCLAVSMLRLAKAGYKIVMHVHDEVILEEPYGTGSLENACAIMGQAIDWAPDLLLRADGYETEYYKKD